MTVAPRGPDKHGQHHQDPPEELAEHARVLAPFILAQIQNTLHLPLQLPDVAKLEELKNFDPELYKRFINMVADQHAHDLKMESAPFDVPARIAKRGQYLGFGVVLAVLVLAGFMVGTGHPGWATGLVGIDVVALAAVFARPAGDKDPPKRH